MRRLAYILALCLLAGCSAVSFEPYDYVTAEDAKLKAKGYHVRLRGKQFKLEKKISLPLTDER